jgi:hypothetical protein
VVAPRLTPDWALGPAVQPRVPAGAGLAAERGLCSSAPLARLAQAGGPAVRRVGARQRVAVTPGRPVVMPGVRRSPAVPGMPRSRGLHAVGVHDHRGPWWTPQPRPSWLARETRAARPAALARREGREPRSTPGFRTRQITLVTTRLEAAVYRVRDLAER